MVEHYKGWLSGNPQDFWFTNFNNRSGTLVGQRVTAVSVSHITKLPRGPSASNPLKAHNSFARGASFHGHQAALEHEIELLTAAAKDKYNQAERTRGRLLAETEKGAAKKSGLIGAEVKAPPSGDDSESNLRGRLF